MPSALCHCASSGVMRSRTFALVAASAFFSACATGPMTIT